MYIPVVAGATLSVCRWVFTTDRAINVGLLVAVATTALGLCNVPTNCIDCPLFCNHTIYYYIYIL